MENNVTEKKSGFKSLWWIWPLINTLLIVVLIGMKDVDRQIIDSRFEKVEQNTQEIEKIKYHIEQESDTIVIINNNNIYMKKK